MRKVRFIEMLALLSLWAGGLGGSRGGLAGEFPKGAKGRAEVAVAVEIAPVERGEIRDLRVFTGTLLPRARFVFAPKIAGRLLYLPFHIGDTIPSGAVVAKLDDEEYRQQVYQAAASLEVAKATVEQQATELALAQREMDRIKFLREKNIAAEADWDQAEARYKARAAQLRVAEAQMHEKEAALKAAEVRLSYATIISPPDSDGGIWRVEERYVDVGAMLAANMPILSVVDLRCVIAVIHVIERDYPSLAVGLPVEMTTDAYPGQRFTGKVLRIAPVLRESSRQARVEIEIPNESLLLRPGMFIRATLEFARHPDARLIPRTAFVKRDGKPGVFWIESTEKGKAIARFYEVKPGILTQERVEILEPPLEGYVVTLGHHLLSNGSPVLLPMKTNMPSPSRKSSPTPSWEGKDPSAIPPAPERNPSPSPREEKQQEGETR